MTDRLRVRRRPTSKSGSTDDPMGWARSAWPMELPERANAERSGGRPAVSLQADALEEGSPHEPGPDGLLNSLAMLLGTGQTTHPTPHRNEVRYGVSNHIERRFCRHILPLIGLNPRRVVEIRSKRLVQARDLGRYGVATAKAGQVIRPLSGLDQHRGDFSAPNVQILQRRRRSAPHALAERLHSAVERLPAVARRERSSGQDHGHRTSRSDHGSPDG